VKEMAEETDPSQAPPLARCFYPNDWVYTPPVLLSELGHFVDTTVMDDIIVHDCTDWRSSPLTSLKQSPG